MIEVLLELKLDSFLVNSTGDSSGLPATMSTKALRFSCEKILSARQLTEEKPSADFEFLGSASKNENKIESDTEFDAQIIKYLSSHTQIDTSKVMVAFGDAGYCTTPKEASNGEIGRIFIQALPSQSSLNIELVLKQNEFDAVWELTTKHKIQKVIGTFVCFKLKRVALDANSESKRVVGVLSSSLQMMPNA
jgi:hypothetical protein